MEEEAGEAHLVVEIVALSNGGDALSVPAYLSDDLRSACCKDCESKGCPLRLVCGFGKSSWLRWCDWRDKSLSGATKELEYLRCSEQGCRNSVGG